MKKLLCLAALLLAVACKKETADPGPTGANTFSCRIEGQDFAPYLPPVILGGVKALAAGRIDAKGGLLIDARNSLNKLEIYLTTAHAPGTYQLGYARNPVRAIQSRYSYFASLEG